MVPDIDGPAAGSAGSVGLGLPVDAGTDTDGDGEPDTVLVRAGDDLLILTDLDGDGFADQVLHIGADATVTAVPGPPDDSLDGPAAPHPAAVPPWWWPWWLRG